MQDDLDEPGAAGHPDGQRAADHRADDGGRRGPAGAAPGRRGHGADAGGWCEVALRLCVTTYKHVNMQIPTPSSSPTYTSGASVYVRSLSGLLSYLRMSRRLCLLGF